MDATSSWAGGVPSGIWPGGAIVGGELAAVSLLSYCAATALNFVVPVALRRWGLHDRANGRSSHAGAVLRGGGIGFVTVATLAALGAMWVGGQPDVAGLLVLGGAALIAGLGLVDDGVGLSAKTRLAVHLVAAGSVAWALLPEASWIVLGVIAVAIAWSVNLTNFMDGIDGIAACQGAFVLGALGAASCWIGSDSVAVVALACTAAVAAFIPWNITPARMFMGDVGSGWIGFLIAAVGAWAVREGVCSWWTLLTLDSLFVADATATLLLRAASGQKFWEAHRSHAYQRLSDTLGSHTRVTAIFASLNLGVVLPLAATCQALPAIAPWVSCGLVLTLMLLAAAVRRGGIDH